MSDNSRLEGRKFFVVFRSAVALFSTLLFPNVSLAHLYVPPSYAIVSDDHQFLLVMRSFIKKENDEGRIFKLPSGQQIDLTEKFQTNGIFRLDNFECIQPINWFADDGELFVSGDFKIIIRLNRFAVKTQTNASLGWCMKFYNDAKEVKQYQLRDLVQISNPLYLPYYRDEWYETAKFTDPNPDVHFQNSKSNCSQFSLVATPQTFGRIFLSEGNEFLFDASTGKIIKERRHSPFIRISFILLPVFAGLFVILFFIFRPRKLLTNEYPASPVNH